MNHEKNGERGGNLNREKSFQLNHISSDVWDVLLSHYIIWTKTNGSHNSRNSKCDLQLPGNPIFVKILFLPWLPSQFSRRKKKRKKKASQVVIDHRIGIELEYGSWFAVLFRGKRFSEIKRFSCLIHYVPILHRRFSDVSGAKCRTYDVIIANSSFGTPHSRSLIIHGMRSRFQLFKNKFRSKHSFCNPIPLKSGETGPLFT